MNLVAQIQRKVFSLPISRKVVLVCATASLAALALLLGLSIYRDWVSFKHRHISTITTLSEIIANNSEAILYFRDAKRAEEVLSYLQYYDGIKQIALFDNDQDLLASFAHQSDAATLAFPDFIGARWDERGLFHAKEITIGDTLLGTLLIEANDSQFSDSMMQSIVTSIAIFATALVFSLFLASRLQPLITQPIHDLDSVAKSIRDHENYTVRAVKKYNDEVGSLVESFNAMLDRIEERDASLREANTNLEKTVECRTNDLRQKNLDLQTAMEAARAASIAKSEFLATTSHELRTPLNPIIGYVEKILRQSPDSEHKKELSLIKQAAEQLLRLIEDILDFSRIESGTLKFEVESVNPVELCDDVVKLLAPQAKAKDLQIEHIRSDHLNDKDIIVDKARLRQVLLNLANNAIKFTEDGSVRIESELQLSSPSKGKLTLKVRDTGMGISREDQKKLFKAFSQLDSTWTREHGGMGLGLAISKRIVNAMGGDLVCSSELGSGSCFTATLPVEVTKRLEAPEPVSDLPDDLSRNLELRILLVEDEAVNRELMDALLSSLGHRVTTARNGLEALKIATEEEFDFGIFDISMPKMDGFETTRRIRKLDNRNSDMPIVAMTAHVTPEDRKACFEAGMNDYLSKPVSFTKLRSTVAKWIDQKKPMA